MKYAQQMTSPKEALDRVLELAVLVHHDMQSSLGTLGLTPSRAHALWELHRRGPGPQRALADALGVTPRHVTGLVDALVEHELAVREPHPQDRRAVLVRLTDKGRATAEDFERGQAEFADLLFGQMSADRFDCLVLGLDEVLARLRPAVATQEVPGA